MWRNMSCLTYVSILFVCSMGIEIHAECEWYIHSEVLLNAMFKLMSALLVSQWKKNTTITTGTPNMNNNNYSLKWGSMGLIFFFYSVPFSKKHKNWIKKITNTQKSLSCDLKLIFYTIATSELWPWAMAQCILVYPYSLCSFTCKHVI